MTQALFIAGTAPGVGKTTAAQALVDMLMDASYDAAYYKPIVSGTDSIPESDAGRVRAACGLEQDILTLTSYVFKDPVSPHLAAAQMMQPVDPDMIAADFASVALLHDVAEDTAVTLEDLAHVFPPAVVHALALLTHQPGTSYDDYIRTLRGDPIAATVKRADLLHNSDESRLALCPISDAEKMRLRQKYQKALTLLEGQDR